MASKKYFLLAGFICLLSSYGYSQDPSTTTYDVADSSVVPSRRLPQHTEFMNGTYNYPAKPRSQWEFGIKAGSFTISGDVPVQFSPGFGAHIRKAFGYLFSARLNYMYANGKGLHWQPSSNYHYNTAWTKSTGYGGSDIVYYNYKTNVQDLSLEGIFTLNNIRFHKSRTGYNLYALVGIGGSMYDARVNALNGNAKYNFNGIQGGVYKDRKETRDQLKNFNG
jgi:hypothetical protein